METLAELRAQGHKPEVLFLEAADETLVRRYQETRRRHPLAGEGSVLEGIRAERRALGQPARERGPDHRHHRACPSTSSRSAWSRGTGTQGSRATR